MFQGPHVGGALLVVGLHYGAMSSIQDITSRLRYLQVGLTGDHILVSREKKEVPRVREKLKAWPWLARVWQKARHWVDMEEETSSHIVASII